MCEIEEPEDDYGPKRKCYCTTRCYFCSRGVVHMHLGPDDQPISLMPVDISVSYEFDVAPMHEHVPGDWCEYGGAAR